MLMNEDTEKETMYEKAVFDLCIFGVSVKTEYT